MLLRPPATHVDAVQGLQHLLHPLLHHYILLLRHSELLLQHNIFALQLGDLRLHPTLEVLPGRVQHMDVPQHTVRLHHHLLRDQHLSAKRLFITVEVGANKLIVSFANTVTAATVDHIRVVAFICEEAQVSSIEWTRHGERSQVHRPEPNASPDHTSPTQHRHCAAADCAGTDGAIRAGDRRATRRASPARLGALLRGADLLLGWLVGFPFDKRKQFGLVLPEELMCELAVIGVLNGLVKIVLNGQSMS